jgi:hypothetical protein
MALEALAHRPTARQAARLEHRSFQGAAFRDMASHEMELVGMALQGADVNPASPEAHSNFGLAFLDLKRPEEAFASHDWS